MSISLETQINGVRSKSKQDWSIGNTVKVGFLNLRVKEKTGYGYKLESLNGEKQYGFEPHQGVYRI